MEMLADERTEEELIFLFNQGFKYVPALAEELGIPVNTIYEMIGFDSELGRPKDGSEFPNAFKERPGSRTARIRIPDSDVRAFKIKAVKGTGSPSPTPTITEGKENGNDPT